jgi:hypothetical protein
VPGIRGAEGEEKGKGVTARWGLEEAQSKRAGRRTGTGYEVWYTRDERARDREVLHPQGVCLINPASMRGTFGVLPWEICRSSQAGLRAEGSVLTDRQKSAEGIVGGVTQPPGEIRTDELGTRPVDRKSRGRKLSA